MTSNGKTKELSVTVICRKDSCGGVSDKPLQINNVGRGIHGSMDRGCESAPPCCFPGMNSALHMCMGPLLSVIIPSRTRIVGWGGGEETDGRS